MLPTRPRLAARSMSSSCTWPAASTATRVSWGVTLTSISSVTLLAKLSSLMHGSHALEQLRGLVERQPQDPGEAAVQSHHELRGAALDRISAGLVVAFAGRDVLADLLGRQRLEIDLGYRNHALELRFVLDRNRRQHLVPGSRQRREHVGRLAPVGRLAEDACAERHRGIGGQDGGARQAALLEAGPPPPPP